MHADVSIRAPHRAGDCKLHFGMKSRLLQPQDVDAREQIDAAPLPQRRESDIEDTLAAIEGNVASEAAIAQAHEKPLPLPRPTPQVSARPRGRLVVVAILLGCIGLLGNSLWSTFLRDAAYGVVTGKVTAISPPWSGTVTAVYPNEGDAVRQGEVLAIVDDLELQYQIDRLVDELRAAQAELNAQAALLTLAARERQDEAAQMRFRYHDLRGQLLSEKSRLAELSSKLDRREALAHQRAYSDEEIESLTHQKQGLTAKIDHLQQAVDAFQPQIDNLFADNHEQAQLAPWLSKIENAQAEIRRLRDKQRRGTLRAPFNGTVVKVHRHVGERAELDQPLLEVLPVDATELVLYVSQQDCSSYRVGQLHKIVVDPEPQPISCEVTRVGTRLEHPQSLVVGRHRPDERLVPIYLKPRQAAIANSLRLGSTIRLPATYFGSPD